MNTLAEIIRTYDIVAIQEIRDRSQVALNAEGSYFDKDKASSLSGGEYCWLIDNGMDTTTGNTDCTYDRIIITENTDSHFTGDAGCTQV